MKRLHLLLFGLAILSLFVYIYWDVRDLEYLIGAGIGYAMIKLSLTQEDLPNDYDR